MIQVPSPNCLCELEFKSSPYYILQLYIINIKNRKKLSFKAPNACDTTAAVSENEQSVIFKNPPFKSYQNVDMFVVKTKKHGVFYFCA